MLNFRELKSLIENNSTFLLTTHVNPDADAIGSEVALYLILKKLDKKVFIINHSITPYNLLFLDTDNKIEHYSEENHPAVINEVDVIVALDFNRADRVVSMKENFLASKAVKICIDHHQEPEEKSFNYLFVDQTYCATGHILYDFIKQTGIVELDYNIAMQLYAAIMTDTGSFRFDRTSPELHRIIAELLELKISPNIIYDSIYDQSKFSKIKLLGKALDSLQLYGEERKISYMVLFQDAFKTLDAVESDTDSFVNFSLSIENVKIGLLFIELRDGFKVSFRSKGNIPVNKLAAEFGGGGHTNAAGARFYHQKLIDFIPSILRESEKYLNY